MSLPKNKIEAEIKQNMGIIHTLARSFARFGVDYNDLLQEAYLGVMLAAEKFDPARGLKFITYAVWWIRARMSLAVERAHGIRTTQARKVFWKGRRIVSKLATAGVEVDSEMLAKLLKLKPQTVVDAATAMRPKVRIDNPDFDMHRRLPSGAATPEEAVEAAEAADNITRAHEAMRMALSKLEARERQIVELRYLTENPKTLAQVGEKFGISRERTRQIEMRALTRMRSIMEAA